MEKAKINYPKGRPQVETGKEMLIGAYWCPEPSERAYRLCKECNFTHLLVNPTKGNPVSRDDFASNTLALAEKAGIKIIYHCNNHSYKSLEKHFDVIRANKTCTGIFVWDEPPFDKFDMLGSEYEDFKKDFPDMPYYVNTWPVYSCKEQRGIQSYYRYMEAYRDKIVKNLDPKHRAFFCDIYPMLNNEKIYEKWLFNVEYVKDLAESVNADLYLFFIAQSFSDRRQHTKPEEYIFQTYVYLAYGVKGLSYCPYQTPFAGDDPNNPTTDPGIVELNGDPSPVYPLAQANNAEIQRIDSAYLGFKWHGVIPIDGDDTTERNPVFRQCNNFMHSFGMLNWPNYSATHDALVGCFDNDEGYQAFVLVNFTEPLHNKQNTITLKFDADVDKAIVYLKGVPHTFDIIDGVFKVTLGGGEGALVVPYKE